jgi:hypothetical protein
MVELRVRARYLASSLVVLMLLAACAQPAPQAGTSAPAATAGATAGATATDKTFVYGFTQNPVGGCDGTQITVVATTGNCPLLNQEALIRYDDATKKIVPASGLTVVYNYRRVWDTSFPAGSGA